MMKVNNKIKQAIDLLNLHYKAFSEATVFANATKQPVPSDSRAWSQILVSLLTGIPGLERGKGSDLNDGSDVKAAIVWEAIDTPRFNGVIKAGTKSNISGKIEYLDNVPFLFLVMWDENPDSLRKRCRIWCVRPQKDGLFRKIANDWYKACELGVIKSTNFQLHPPRNQNSNMIRSSFGNLVYPLFFEAEYLDDSYYVTHYNPEVLISGECTEIE